MKTLHTFSYTVLYIFFAIASTPVNSFAGDYKSLNGLNDIKAVFDVRAKKIKTAAIQLDLIHQTFWDGNIREITGKPHMAVVFGGAAVKLLSTNRDGYTDEEKILLDHIATKISEMVKQGIRLEICLFAADVFDVEPATVLPGIHHVPNGWISLIGYQAQGYSLVPVY